MFVYGSVQEKEGQFTFTFYAEAPRLLCWTGEHASCAQESWQLVKAWMTYWDLRKCKHAKLHPSYKERQIYIFWHQVSNYSVRVHVGTDGFPQGLNNYIDTKSKCHHRKNWTVKLLCSCCLSEFNYWRYSQSCWYFQLSFVNYCLSPFSMIHVSLLPPFPVWISTLYTRIQCVRGVWVSGPLRQINTCR